jgi:hypothetical protein
MRDFVESGQPWEININPMALQRFLNTARLHAGAFAYRPTQEPYRAEYRPASVRIAAADRRPRPGIAAGLRSPGHGPAPLPAPLPARVSALQTTFVKAHSKGTRGSTVGLGREEWIRNTNLNVADTIAFA